MKRLFSLLIAIIVFSNTYMCLFMVEAANTSATSHKTTTYNVSDDNIHNATSESCHSEELSEKKQDILSTRFLIKTYAPEIIDETYCIDTFGDWYVMEFPTVEEAEFFKSYYSKSKEVEYVEDVVVSKPDSTVSYEKNASEKDYWSYGSELVGARKAKQQLIEKYGSENNIPQVVVAVLDTGIDSDHEAFKGRLLPQVAGKDYCFATDIKSTVAEDDNGHGTHVAGIIVNSTPSNVKIRAYKVSESTGIAYQDSIIAAIYAAIEDNVDVINLSFSSSHGIAIVDAVKAAYDKGIAFCTSSGNSSQSADITAFDRCEWALNISAVDENKEFAHYSNLGNSIDFAAPGSNILSAMLGGGYVEETGTSMASPFASACCATVLSYNKSMNVSSVYKTLQENAIDLGEKGKDIRYGYGLINVADLEILDAAEFPQASKKGANYDKAISITLSANDPNAEIYYTTDETIPTLQSKKYNGESIAISKSTVLNAISYVEGKSVSPVYSQRYYIGYGTLESDYEISDKGELTLVLTPQSKLKLPSYVRGIKVTRLAEYLFSNENFEFSKIILSDTIEEIGISCFNIPSIESIHLGASVKIVENDCFPALPTLSITVSDKNPYFAIVNNTLFKIKNSKPYELIRTLFPSDSNTTYSIPNSVVYVRKDAFPKDLYLIKYIYVGSNVKDLMYSADKNGYESIRLLNYEYIVDPENPYYCSENGVLYNKDKTILYYYPSTKTSKTFTLDPNVKTIYKYAIHNTYLKTINLNEGLQKIMTRGIMCDLKSIVIPHTVINMGGYCVCTTEYNTMDYYFSGDAPQIEDSGLIPKNIYIYPQAKGFDKGGWEQLSSYYKTRTDGTYKRSYITYEVDGGHILFSPESNTAVGYTGEPVKIDFPNSINNTPLYYIGDYAFTNCSSLKSVSFKENLKEIRYAAFANCPIENVSFSKGIEIIDDLSFFNTEISTTVSLPEGLIKLNASTSMEMEIDSLPKSLKYLDFAHITLSNSDALRITENLETAIAGYTKVPTVLISEKFFAFSRNMFTNPETEIYMQGDFPLEASRYTFGDGITVYIGENATGYENLPSTVNVVRIPNIEDYFEGHQHSFEKYSYNNDGYYGYDGTKTAVCTKPFCKETSTVAAEHVYTETVLPGNPNLVTPAGSNSPAVYYKVCERCLACSNETFARADGGQVNDCNHGFSAYEHTHIADCTKPGVYKRTCTACGLNEYNSEAIAPDVHNGEPILKNAQAATCSNVGYSGDLHCGACGSIIQKGTQLEKISQHTYDDWVTTRESTCVSTGSKYRECIYCYSKQYGTIAKTPGRHTGNQRIVKGKERSCTDNSNWTDAIYCADCGVLLKESVSILYKGPAIPHSFEQNVTQKAEMKHYGFLRYKCTVCGYKKYSVINGISKVTLSKTSYTCTGKSLKPTVKVTDTKGNKISSKYYTVKYTNNKNVGKATVQITFKTRYKGTVKKTFIINPVKAKVKLSSSSLTYTGKKLQPAVTVVNSKGKKISSKYYTVKYSNNKAIGTATVKVTLKSKYKNVIKKTFTITPSKIKIADCYSKSKKYLALKWKPNKSVSGYQLVIEGKNYKKSKYITKTSTCKYTFKKLKSSAKYTIKIRAYKTVKGKKIYGKYVKSAKVKVK